MINVPVLIHAGAEIGGGNAIRSLERLMETAENAGWIVQDRSCEDCSVWKVKGFRNPTKIVFRRIGIPTRVLDVHSLVKGALVAMAKFDNAWPVKEGSPEYHLDAWGHDGLYHWRIKEVNFLKMPISCSGRQRFWNVPAELVNKMEFRNNYLDVKNG
jgi:hypothetical protein